MNDLINKLYTALDTQVAEDMSVNENANIAISLTAAEIYQILSVLEDAE